MTPEQLLDFLQSLRAMEQSLAGFEKRAADAMLPATDYCRAFRDWLATSRRAAILGAAAALEAAGPDEARFDPELAPEAWLESCAADCHCCPCCADVPCAGVMQGGMCDAVPCRGEEAARE